MKSNKALLKEYIRRIVSKYLREAEEEKAEEKPADDKGGEEKADANPFAAGGGDEKEGGEEPAAGEDQGAEDEGGDAEGEEKDTEKKAKPEEPKGIPIKFDISGVKKYNKAGFTSDKGIVKSISKKGIIVTTQPDGVDILVNFDDISEQVKKFFRKNEKKK